MRLLMISGDRSVLSGKRGAFAEMLEEFSKHWERVDVITPKCEWLVGSGEWIGKNTSTHYPPVRTAWPGGLSTTHFSNVFFHPSPHSLWHQPGWIKDKGMELFTAHKHDVMTVHEYPPFYNGYGAARLHVATGIPYALEIHHIVGYPRAANITEWVGRVLSRRWLANDARRASAVRVVNQSVVRVLCGWGIPEEKLSIIPSFYLDRNVLKPDSTIEKKYDVAFAGRLVSNKGLPDVIDAMALMQGKRLIVIGDGPLKAAAMHHAQKKDVADRVTFTGWLNSQSEVMRAIQSAKVFVMNSKSEGGPRIALEAMACGMPIIATRVGVMPDDIEDVVNGLFTSGHAHNLAANIGLLLSDNGLRSHLSSKAQEIVDRFEKTTLIRRYAEFLKGLSK